LADYHDQFLLFELYVKAGWTQQHLSIMFDISVSAVSGYITTWAVMLDAAFARLFPNPTKAELLRCYPTTFVQQFGYADICMLLDGMDLQWQTPSMNKNKTDLWSRYHHQQGSKTLAGCTPIGALPHPWVTEPFPSSISDVKMTDRTGVLKSLRMGDASEVDKGFTINNEAAELGQTVTRPTVLQPNERQQQPLDSALMAAVGNTRVFIEICNRICKANRIWRGAAPIVSSTLIGHLLRVSFMFGNFVVPLIHGRQEGAIGGRACRAAVLYLGETGTGEDAGDGLEDYRARPERWAHEHQKTAIALLQSLVPTPPDADICDVVLRAGETQVGASLGEASVAWERIISTIPTGQVVAAPLRMVATAMLAAVGVVYEADPELLEPR
jgi:hypothetical protein